MLKHTQIQSLHPSDSLRNKLLHSTQQTETSNSNGQWYSLKCTCAVGCSVDAPVVNRKTTVYYKLQTLEYELFLALMFRCYHLSTTLGTLDDENIETAESGQQKLLHSESYKIGSVHFRVGKDEKAVVCSSAVRHLHHKTTNLRCCKLYLLFYYLYLIKPTQCEVISLYFLYVCVVALARYQPVRMI